MVHENFYPYIPNASISELNRLRFLTRKCGLRQGETKFHETKFSAKQLSASVNSGRGSDLVLLHPINKDLD